MMIRNKGKYDGKPFVTTDTLRRMLTVQPKSKNCQLGLFIRKKDKNGKAVVSVTLAHQARTAGSIWKNDIIGIMLTQTRGKDIKPFRIGPEKRINECILK